MEKLGACPSKTVDMSRDDVIMVVASCLVSELHLKEGIEIMVCSHLNFGCEQGGFLGIELERAEGALLLLDGEILAPDRELVSGCWKHTSWKPQVEQQESWKR
ncbi:unnamed protein product [Sphagnum troendelagicum]